MMARYVRKTIHVCAGIGGFNPDARLYLLIAFILSVLQSHDGAHRVTEPGLYSTNYETL